MQIEILTDRLPNKFPMGAVYEVATLETGTPLHALVQQGEAYVIGNEPKFETPVEEVKEEETPEGEGGGQLAEPAEEPVELSREEIKTALKEKGVEFKGNAKTDDLRALLTNE